MGRGSQTIIGALPPAEPRAEPACEKLLLNLSIQQLPTKKTWNLL